jgi:hypothetical protein
MPMGYPFDEFPRNLVLMLDGDAGWERVAYADGPEESWALVRDLVERPRAARLVLRFPARQVRAVRLMVGLREEEPSWPRWRVPEVEIYRDCR